VVYTELLSLTSMHPHTYEHTDKVNDLKKVLEETLLDAIYEIKAYNIVKPTVISQLWRKLFPYNEENKCLGFGEKIFSVTELDTIF